MHQNDEQSKGQLVTSYSKMFFMSRQKRLKTRVNPRKTAFTAKRDTQTPVLPLRIVFERLRSVFGYLDKFLVT